MGREELVVSVCPECGHEVREHQPAYAHQPHGHSLSNVGCQRCNCILTMEAKLKAWGGRRK